MFDCSSFLLLLFHIEHQFLLRKAVLWLWFIKGKLDQVYYFCENRWSNSIDL